MADAFVLDLSEVPGVVTITNTGTKDKRVGISGHSQSFTLAADSSVLLWAKTSSELIGYLSQIGDGITVELSEAE